MKNFRLLLKSYAHLNELQPGSLWVNIFGSIFKALRPFINIYFPARIIEILSTTKSVTDLLICIGLSLTLNLILSILVNRFDEISSTREWQLYQIENNRVNCSLYNVDYKMLENAEFLARVEKYRGYGASPFVRIQKNAGHFAQGIVGLVSSVVLMLPFFRVMFLKTGDGFFQSPWISVLVILTIIICAVVIVIISSNVSKKCHKKEEEYLGIRRLFDFYLDLINDYNSGKEIRLFNEQNLILKQATEKLLIDGKNIQNKIGSYKAISSATYAVIGAVIGFGIYSVIGLKASVGLFGIDSLVKYIGSFFQLVSVVNSFGMLAGNLSSIYPRLREYFYITEMKNEDNGIIDIPVPQKISFQDVCFRYNENAPNILKNITIDFSVGERIAIVGENGSGKTTFIKLLCALYEPNSGMISINDTDIREYKRENYRKLFSVVFQDYKFFSLSLAENIACSEVYNKEKIKKVLEKVGMSNRVDKMENGMQTYLYRDCSNDGVEISGGESQKFALARALYKDAPIIVLDEPTSALDPFAELEVYRSFDTLVKDKTVFYISHRLSSCIFCDKIAVFDNGKIVQFGTHEELIKDQKGKYYELWMAQAQYYI